MVRGVVYEQEALGQVIIHAYPAMPRRYTYYHATLSENERLGEGSVVYFTTTGDVICATRLQRIMRADGTTRVMQREGRKCHAARDVTVVVKVEPQPEETLIDEDLIPQRRTAAPPSGEEESTVLTPEHDEGEKSSEEDGDSTEIVLRGGGLYNQENDCCRSSAIQMLMSIFGYVLDQHPRCGPPCAWRSIRDRGQWLTQGPTEGAIASKSVLTSQAIRWVAGSNTELTTGQQDVGEILAALTGAHEHSDYPEESDNRECKVGQAIQHAIMWTTNETLTCKTCHRVTTKVGRHEIMRLDIPSGATTTQTFEIVNLIERTWGTEDIPRRETVELRCDNKTDDGNCVGQEAIAMKYIATFPQVLIARVMRIRTVTRTTTRSSTTYRAMALRNEVKATEVIEIKPADEKKTRMTLRAVVRHRGGNPRTGHYTSIVQGVDDDEMRRLTRPTEPSTAFHGYLHKDDDKVSPIQHTKGQIPWLTRIEAGAKRARGTNAMYNTIVAYTKEGWRTRPEKGATTTTDDSYRMRRWTVHAAAVRKDEELITVLWRGAAAARLDGNDGDMEISGIQARVHIAELRTKGKNLQITWERELLRSVTETMLTPITRIVAHSKGKGGKPTTMNIEMHQPHAMAEIRRWGQAMTESSYPTTGKQDWAETVMGRVTDTTDKLTPEEKVTIRSAIEGMGEQIKQREEHKQQRRQKRSKKGPKPTLQPAKPPILDTETKLWVWSQFERVKDGTRGYGLRVREGPGHDPPGHSNTFPGDDPTNLDY